MIDISLHCRSLEGVESMDALTTIVATCRKLGVQASKPATTSARPCVACSTKPKDCRPGSSPRRRPRPARLKLATLEAPRHARSALPLPHNNRPLFQRNNTNLALNNGTQMMGHAVPYGPLGGAPTPQPSHSGYDLTVNLAGFKNAELSFDFTGGIEKDFDGFNVLATIGVITPPNDLLLPTAQRHRGCSTEH